MLERPFDPRFYLNISSFLTNEVSSSEKVKSFVKKRLSGKFEVMESGLLLPVNHAINGSVIKACLDLDSVVNDLSRLPESPSLSITGRSDEKGLELSVFYQNLSSQGKINLQYSDYSLSVGREEAGRLAYLYNLHKDVPYNGRKDSTSLQPF